MYYFEYERVLGKLEEANDMLPYHDEDLAHLICKFKSEMAQLDTRRVPIAALYESRQNCTAECKTHPVRPLQRGSLFYRNEDTTVTIRARCPYCA